MKNQPFLNINDNKAGMSNLDKNKINKIILEASKGSKYYDNLIKKESILDKQIKTLKMNYLQLTEDDKLFGEIKADKIINDINVNRDLCQTVVHIDMDAYFAAVEILSNPLLRKKPMAVGSMSMISTSNYEARKFGVRAAMPGFIGKQLCPDLILIEPNFEKYIEISKVFRNIFMEYDPNFCSLGLDEASLDITEHLKRRINFSDNEMTFEAESSCDCDNPDIKSSKHTRLFHVCEECGKIVGHKSRTFTITSWSAVEELRFRIFCKTKLTSTAGIASNSLLAKIVSDINKPNGQYQLMSTEEDICSFMNSLPIRKVPGIGKITESKLMALDINTCGNFLDKRGALYHLFKTVTFEYFMRTAMGECGSNLTEADSEENISGSDRKSISAERTFSDCSDKTILLNKCKSLCHSVFKDLSKAQMMSKCISIKLKLSTFEVRTRAITILDYTRNLDIITNHACDLLKIEMNNEPHNLCLRLLGVRVSSLIYEPLLVRNNQLKIIDLFKKESKKPLTYSKEKQIINRVPVNSESDVICPICSSVINMTSVNQHLDICLLTNNVDQPSTSHCETSFIPVIKRPLSQMSLEPSSKKKIFRTESLDNFIIRTDEN